MSVKQTDALDDLEGDADLTRWNRAGLDRFAYVSHGAAEFTEALRIAHLLLYQRGFDPAALPAPEFWRQAFERDQTADVAKLSSVFSRRQMDGVRPDITRYRDKLLAQYQANLTDPSAQVSRAFARALHVLSETLNAYANEGTLRTATQAHHALSLLSLIGFRPTPAASALVPLAYVLKADQAVTLLPAGTAFDYPLPEGGPNLTFEALEDIQAHPALNAMLPSGHSDRRDAIRPDEKSFALVERSLFSSELKNTVAVIEGGHVNEAVRILSANPDNRTVVLSRSPGFPTDAMLQTARLQTGADKVWPARRRGRLWVHFATAPLVYPGSYVDVEYADDHQEYFRVDEISGRDLRLRSLTDPRKVMEAVGMASTAVAKKTAKDEDDKAFPSGPGKGHAGKKGLKRQSHGKQDVSDEIAAVYATVSGPPKPKDSGDTYEFERVDPWGGLAALISKEPSLWLKRGASLGKLDTEIAPDRVYLEGVTPADLEGYAYLVFELSDGQLFCDTFKAESHGSRGVSIRPMTLRVDPAAVVTVHAGFRTGSAFVAETASRAALADGNGLVSVLCPASQHYLLRPGRQVIVARRDRTSAIEGKIVENGAANADAIVLRIDTGGQGLTGYTRGNSVVHANVARFGHGKSLPGRVLGSGEGERQGQVMELKERAISTRPQPDFPGGVAADIQVTVEGRIWQQVDPDKVADGSGPHYSVQVQSDGSAVVQFHQLLPSGRDNVLLSRVRTGSGADGNKIPAYGVTNLQPKNSAVEAVVQPVAPQGGADLQGIETLRSGGKSRYALFDRALGIDDFARLAESHTGVLHGSAELIRQGVGRGGNIVRVNIVPSGGSGIGLIKGQIETMLLGASLPGTFVDVQAFNPAPLTGRCVVTLMTGYADLATIQAELQAMVLARFALAQRPLGKALYVSELSAAIEDHQAVDFVIPAIDPICETNTGVRCERSVDGAVKALHPDIRTTIYVGDFTGLRIELQLAGQGGA